MSKKLGLIALLLVFISTAASATELPAIVVAYKDVVSGLISQVIVGFIILIMLVFAAYEMKVNGNASPLKWAIFASLVMASAVYFGPSMVDYAGEAFSGYTGDAAATS